MKDRKRSEVEISRFPVYEKYKDSGVEWFGKIPHTWETRKTKYLFRLVTSPAPVGNSEELLSVYTEIGVKPRKELEARGNKASTTDHYWRVKKGDIIVNKLLAWMGAIGISEYDGVTSPAYDVLRKKAKLVPRFYNYLFRNKIAHQEFKRHSRGIMEMRLRLYFDQFGQIFLPYPSEQEQTAIADFLDHKTTLINNFIARKERLIELLQEQKRVIINQAVTRGIDPDVRLKPSGVDWLGDIPEHWEVKKLKYIAKINPSKSNITSQKNSHELVTFLPMEAISTTGTVSNRFSKPIIDLWNGYTYFEKFDIVIAKITPCFENGKIAFLDKLTSEFGFGTTEFHVLRANKNMLPLFLFYTLKSERFMTLGEENMVGTAGQKRVPTAFVSNYLVAYPDRTEQQRIIKSIEEKNSDIDNAIAKASQEIFLIKEYREALIAEAVTGKIDVRGWRQQREKAA